VIQTKQKASPKWPQPMLLLVTLLSGEIRDTFSYTTEMSTPHRYLAGDTLRPFDELLVESPSL
jgi:hypothetical protein